jgi:Tol biopolymer transport system component
VRQIPGPICFCSYPRWSPDGTQIAYASQHDGTWDIFTMNPDGSDIRQVTQRDPDNYIAEWVSDAQLIFGGDEVGTPGIDLLLINTDGSGEVQLNQNQFSEESFPTTNP